jgi:uncharacterized membrane protein
MGALTRKKLIIIMLFLIFPQLTNTYAVTIPNKIRINVKNDGVTSLNYIFNAEITELQTNVSLLGKNQLNLLVINEDGLPLEYTKIGNNVSIYTLGSSLVNLTYLTSDLTGKTGVIWCLNVSLPVSTQIIFPTGSIIVNLNVIPLEIDVSDGRTSVVMPSGLGFIEYTVNIIKSDILAKETIAEAELAIQMAEKSNIIVERAKSILIEAKTFFLSGNFLEAEEKASDCIDLLNEIIELSGIALSKINAAESAIDSALESGRTNGLDVAESLLNDARIKYDAGDYGEAVIIADQSLQSAVSAEKEGNNSIFYAGIIVASLATVGMYFYSRKKPAQIVLPTKVEVEFDLERLFKEHTELRLDDREVLKFLSENEGEAFSYDIRERFDLPRTSAWRMIKRLQRYDIVSERKVGGQSFIRIKEKYRRAKE